MGATPAAGAAVVMGSPFSLFFFFSGLSPWRSGGSWVRAPLAYDAVSGTIGVVRWGWGRRPSSPLARFSTPLKELLIPDVPQGVAPAVLVFRLPCGNPPSRVASSSPGSVVGGPRRRLASSASFWEAAGLEGGVAPLPSRVDRTGDGALTIVCIHPRTSEEETRVSLPFFPEACEHRKEEEETKEAEAAAVRSSTGPDDHNDPLRSLASPSGSGEHCVLAPPLQEGSGDMVVVVVRVPSSCFRLGWGLPAEDEVENVEGREGEDGREGEEEKKEREARPAMVGRWRCIEWTTLWGWLRDVLLLEKGLLLSLAWMMGVVVPLR